MAKATKTTSKTAVKKAPAKKAAAKPAKRAERIVVDVSDKPARAKKTALPNIAVPAARQPASTTAKTFKKGDVVTWGSSAMGSTTTKTGKIIAVIPGGKGSYDKVRDEIRRIQQSHNTSAFGFGSGRDHESYLVAVPQGTTGRAKPKVYWPNVKALSLA